MQLCSCDTLVLCMYVSEVIIIFHYCSYADRAKQIVCKAIVNEDPNAKVCTLVSCSLKHCKDYTTLVFIADT